MSLLEFRGVALVRPGSVALDAVSFQAEPGDGLAVFGLSGSGKHELLQLAAGLLLPTRGEILLADPRPEPRLTVGYVMKEGGLINNLNLLENVMLPAVYHGLLSVEEARAKGRDLLGRFGLARHAALRPAALGRNARRLTQIARSLLAAPSLFVLDDPFDDVDVEGAQMIMDVLEQIRDARKAVVLVAAGNLGPYMGWAKRFLWTRRGAVEVFEGRAALKSCADPQLGVFIGEA